MKIQGDLIGKAILFFWLFVMVALFLFFVGVQVAAYLDYDTINALMVRDFYIKESGTIEPRGFVEIMNAFYFDLYVKGKVLNLFVFNTRSILWSILVVLQVLFVAIYLFQKARSATTTGEGSYYSGCAALLIYVAVSVNLAGAGDWTTASTLAFFEVQSLYDFGYWGSVELWLDTHSWSFLGWIVVGAIVLYTLVKAHVIVTTTSTGNVKEDTKKMLLGCSMAAFAPYRLSQYIGATRDQESEDTMNEVRTQTLKVFRVRPEATRKVNDILTRERSGMVGLTDLSSSYLPLIMSQQTKAPK